MLFFFQLVLALLGNEMSCLQLLLAGNGGQVDRAELIITIFMSTYEHFLLSCIVPLQAMLWTSVHYTVYEF